MKKISSFCLVYIGIFTAFVVCMVSCNNTFNGSSVEYPVEELDSVAMLNRELGVPDDSCHIDFYYYEKSKLRFFLSRFIKENPDCFNNDIAAETYSGILKNKIDSVLERDSTFIMDLVVTYDDIISKDAVDKKTGKKMYLINCKSGCIGEGFYSSDKYDYRVEYSVVGAVSKEDMLKIKKHKEYKISGNITSRVDKDYDGNVFNISQFGHMYIGCFFVKDLKLIEQ